MDTKQLLAKLDAANDEHAADLATSIRTTQGLLANAQLHDLSITASLTTALTGVCHEAEQYLANPAPKHAAGKPASTKPKTYGVHSLVEALLGYLGEVEIMPTTLDQAFEYVWGSGWQERQIHLGKSGNATLVSTAGRNALLRYIRQGMERVDHYLAGSAPAGHTNPGPKIVALVEQRLKDRWPEVKRTLETWLAEETQAN